MSDILSYLWGLPAPRMAHQTGSRFICDPPVLTTDDDYVVYGTRAALEKLCADGFQITSPVRGYDINGFIALRRGEINLIFTQDQQFYHRFVKATRLAKRLNLREREQRVALFQAVLYDRYPG